MENQNENIGNRRELKGVAGPKAQKQANEVLYEEGGKLVEFGNIMEGKVVPEITRDDDTLRPREW